MKISIPQMAGRVTFAPLPFNAYLVDGDLEGEDFPLHPGDYVLEIDGTPLSDAGENQRLWAQAWAGESTTFLIAREGRRFTITFNPKALKKGRVRAYNARYD
jgi:S1-C subfamily serine protease